ncbi:MAG TPA: head GIN domain-containing protein [Perlabentimonas sp.]|jgi:hypothetical protein|nr:DUF2807 domain-containing protein [Bacteroidales bacterium]MDD4673745.1 DUF2807 domain-containing protein [Bacteroidales bacterium]MDY0348946.1 head GIN domain-containing protein [Tenuifilaceae bacterium]HZJ73513.1 head GIN domain-containing protein [Perlabentimonas sp.]
MRTTIIAAALTIVSLGFASNGSAQDIDISDVTSIEINIACNLTVVQGINPSIVIDGNDEDVANIELIKRNKKLTVKSYKRNQRKQDISVTIEVKNLETLALSGAVDVESIDMLEFENFRMSVSGVASGEMSLTGKRFDLDCSGVCNLDFEGKYDELEINVSGVGNINASELAARKADVSNSGVGKVSVLAIDHLKASVSGVGSISYAGNPEINTSVSGLGRIRRY